MQDSRAGDHVAQQRFVQDTMSFLQEAPCKAEPQDARASMNIRVVAGDVENGISAGLQASSLSCPPLDFACDTHAAVG